MALLLAIVTPVFTGVTARMPVQVLAPADQATPPPGQVVGAGGAQLGPMGADQEPAVQAIVVAPTLPLVEFSGTLVPAVAAAIGAEQATVLPGSVQVAVPAAQGLYVQFDAPLATQTPSEQENVAAPLAFTAALFAVALAPGVEPGTWPVQVDPSPPVQVRAPPGQGRWVAGAVMGPTQAGFGPLVQFWPGGQLKPGRMTTPVESTPAWAKAGLAHKNRFVRKVSCKKTLRSMMFFKMFSGGLGFQFSTAKMWSIW